MIKENPILVTGCPRSGTSIVAAVINHCGAFLGKTTKRSMLENIVIKENLMNPYLTDMRVSRSGQFPLPDLSLLQIPIDWREKVLAFITEQEGDGIWMYKSNCASLIWPVWKYAFPDAKWIIVRRKTSDIINSCLKTGYMNAFSDEDVRKQVSVDNEYDGWLWWVRQYEKRFTEIANEGLDYKVIWPERLVNNNFDQIHEILDWCDLRWKNDIPDFINPLLWGKKKGGK